MARMLAFEALPVALGVVHGLDLTVGFELVAESPSGRIPGEVVSLSHRDPGVVCDNLR
jgi:hypothetical protein